MFKIGLKILILLIFFCLALSPVVKAEKQNPESQDGKMVYQIHYDYDAIYALLGIDGKEYNRYWKKGLSIAEMAEKQGVSRRDLEGYFADYHYREMQKWKEKGTLSEEDYFQLVYTLKADIAEFINRNPNK
ncbi:hypothetical protein WMZ97_16535 [Lentibacillus sp. N15]|uniref:hypothetical protein n=1 Tax=Lentibacillus songyuanensis TaxID=3136161 RepID=UPI0031B9FDE3